MQRSFIDELKYQWQYGGMHIKLIGVNILVFLFIGTFSVFAKLSAINGASPTISLIEDLFTLHGTWEGFILRPWGLVTSIFAHFEFFHFLFNMIFLYFAGSMFMRYFNGKRLLYTYFMGGILGGLFQLIAYSIFPALQGIESYVVGASGSIMAIFVAVAFHRPQEKILFFGIVPVRLIFLALFFILVDFFRLGDNDNVAHFAHLGGAIFGIWSIQHLYSKNNIITLTERWIDRIKKPFQKGPKLKVKKGGYQTDARKMTDEEYNAIKKKKQEQVDRILDKISKSGYDSLTKQEKAILFDQSKNG